MTALVLFIDNPEHASLKPALAAAIPAESAHGVYDGILRRLRNLTALFAGEKYLFYSHYPNWNDGWDINRYRKRIQSGETIPSRINAAISDISDEHPESILWMGTDAVALESSQLEQFLAVMQDADLVIGESATGEILMLGFGPQTFPFGMPETFSADEIVAIAENSGLTVIRIALPDPPATVERLAQLGINLD